MVGCLTPRLWFRLCIVKLDPNVTVIDDVNSGHEQRSFAATTADKKMYSTPLSELRKIHVWRLVHRVCFSTELPSVQLLELLIQRCKFFVTFGWRYLRIGWLTRNSSEHEEDSDGAQIPHYLSLFGGLPGRSVEPHRAS